jgi:hypothetical protein
VKVLRCAPLLLIVLASGAAPPPDPEALLREGNAAVARGDLQAAASSYARALERTTDPAPVAFNLAAVRLRLAVEGPPEDRPRELREAELLFGSFTRSGNPRRARALYGVGVCQLQRAEGGDLAAARSAVGCFRECLLEPSVDASLVEDARHNLARARLLALQLAPPPQSSENQQEPPGDGMKDPPKPPDRNSAGDERSDATGTEKKSGDDLATPPEGGEARETSARNPHGRSGAPTIPDRNEPTPLGTGDAAAYLEKAGRALRADREQQRRQQAASPSLPDVRDW